MGHAEFACWVYFTKIVHTRTIIDRVFVVKW